LAHGFKWCVRVAGNFAQMNPLPTESAPFVERKMSYFGHCQNEYRQSAPLASGSPKFFLFFPRARH